MKNLKSMPYKFLLLITLLTVSTIGYIKSDFLIKAYARSNASLLFTETNVLIEPAEKYSIPVKLDTKSQDVVGIDVVVTYDPKIIKILGSGSLEAFDNPVISDIDNENGIAKFHLINNENHYINANKNVLAITVIGNLTGNTNLNIKMKQNETTKGTVSHVTLNDKSDALGTTNSLLIKVRFAETNTNKQIAYGITKQTDYDGIKPANPSLSPEKVLGASTQKQTFMQKALDTIKTPVAIAISISSFILAIVGIKIYKAYKRTLDDNIKEL